MLSMFQTPFDQMTEPRQSGPDQWEIRTWALKPGIPTHQLNTVSAATRLLAKTCFNTKLIKQKQVTLLKAPQKQSVTREQYIQDI